MLEEVRLCGAAAVRHVLRDLAAAMSARRLALSQETAAAAGSGRGSPLLMYHQLVRIWIHIKNLKDHTMEKGSNIFELASDSSYLLSRVLPICCNDPLHPMYEHGRQNHIL